MDLSLCILLAVVIVCFVLLVVVSGIRFKFNVTREGFQNGELEQQIVQQVQQGQVGQQVAQQVAQQVQQQVAQQVAQQVQQQVAQQVQQQVAQQVAQQVQHQVAQQVNGASVTTDFKQVQEANENKQEEHRTLFHNAECKPECCSNGRGTFSCSTGCVCVTDDHLDMITRNLYWCLRNT